MSGHRFTQIKGSFISETPNSVQKNSYEVKKFWVNRKRDKICNDETKINFVTVTKSILVKYEIFSDQIGL